MMTNIDWGKSQITNEWNESHNILGSNNQKTGFFIVILFKGLLCSQKLFAGTTCRICNAVL